MQIVLQPCYYNGKFGSLYGKGKSFGKGVCIDKLKFGKCEKEGCKYNHEPTEEEKKQAPVG